MTYLVKDVTALWPKLNRTYKFDNGEKRSVPCAPTDDGAEYSINFEMTRDQAMELHAYCQKAWDDYCTAEGKPGETFANKPYKADKENPEIVIGKAKLKGAYGGEATRAPQQFDSTNQPLPDGFQLTTGSRINVAVVAIPYATGMAQGVSVRLRAVQVLEVKEDSSAASPFGAVEGGFKASEANPFIAQKEGLEALSPKTNPAQPQPPVADLEDEIPF